MSMTHKNSFFQSLRACTPTPSFLDQRLQYVWSASSTISRHLVKSILDGSLYLGPFLKSDCNPLSGIQVRLPVTTCPAGGYRNGRNYDTIVNICRWSEGVIFATNLQWKSDRAGHFENGSINNVLPVWDFIFTPLNFDSWGHNSTNCAQDSTYFSVTDLGHSVGVTTATQLVWLNGLHPTFSLTAITV